MYGTPPCDFFAGLFFRDGFCKKLGGKIYMGWVGTAPVTVKSNTKSATGSEANPGNQNTFLGPIYLSIIGFTDTLQVGPRSSGRNSRSWFGIAV